MCNRRARGRTKAAPRPEHPDGRTRCALDGRACNPGAGRAPSPVGSCAGLWTLASAAHRSTVVPAVRRRSKTSRRVALAFGATALAAVWLTASRVPATIAEQRARLPPAAECDDEIVAGIWRSHSYWPRQREWYVMTLYVQRVPSDPTQLEGRITSHFWTGGPEDEEPPPCDRQPHFEATVSFDARGRVTEGNQIFFGGVGRWRLDQSQCGRTPSGYNLDNFSGVIDPRTLEFQSVNNDGGLAVDVPAVFRRIRCPPPVSVDAPSVNPRPPAFYPDSGGGCGRW